MKRSLRKHVSVFLAGAMTLSVFAQTGVFAAEASADGSSDANDAVVSGGAVASSVKNSNSSKTQATEVKVLDDSTSNSSVQVLAGTGFQALIGDTDKAKNDWKVGDTFKADLLFNDANNVGINNFTIKLTYNSDVIEPVGIDEGDVVYTDASGKEYKLVSADRVKAQNANGTVDETTKIKTVVLAAVAGLPDDGTNISALDKNYVAKGSKLFTITFKVKSLGKAVIGIDQYSDASVLNTLNAAGEIVTVKDGDFALVGDEINFAKTEAEFNIAPNGYDITLSAKDGTLDVKGALAKGFAEENGTYKVNLIDDADIAGLIDAIDAVDAGANVTITKIGTDGVQINYMGEQGKTVETVFTFAAAETKVAYKATSTDGIGVEKTGKDAALNVTSTVSGSKVSGTTVTLTDGVDAEAYAKNLVDQLNKQDYVTAEYKMSNSENASEAVITITFEKKANEVANKTNAVGPVVDTVTITSAKITEKTTTFTVSGKDLNGNDKSAEVSITSKDGVVTAKTVNGVEVTLPEDNGMVLIPVNFKADAATNGVSVVTDENNVCKAEVDGVTLRFVMFGDVNLDSTINAADFAQVKAHARKIKLLSGISETLGDVNADEQINAADFAQVKAKARKILNDPFGAETKYNLK